MALGVEAELGDVVLGVARADRLEQADRHHVLGAGQCGADGDRAVVAAVVVLGLPGLAAGLARREGHRRVVHHAVGAVALLEGRRIDEGLEAGARLAPRLGDVVELVAREVEAAGQRADRAGARVGGGEGALDLGQLGDLPAAVVVAGDAHDGAGADALVGRALLAHHAVGEAQALAADADRLAVAIDGDGAAAGLGDDGRQHVVVVGGLGEDFVHRLALLALHAGRVDVGLGAAVAVAAVVVQDAAAQGAVGGVLFGLVDGGDDLDAAGVGLFLELFVGDLAGHLGHVVGAAAEVAGAGDHLERRLDGLALLGLADEAELQHPPQHVLLALRGALRVDHRVVGGGRLGQAGEHRRLGDVQVADGFPEVGVGGYREAVGAPPEEDLVDVDLENLVFREILLDLEGEEYFVKLARDGFLSGEEEVPCNLHSDRGCSLAFAAGGEVGAGGPQDAQEVHARVLVEAVVLGGEDRLLEHRGHVLDADEGAPLLAVLPDQGPVGRVDAQRDLGVVVGQGLERGQGRPGGGDSNGDDRNADRDEAEQGGERVKEPAHEGGQEAKKSVHYTSSPGLPPVMQPRRFTEPCFTPVIVVVRISCRLL